MSEGIPERRLLNQCIDRARHHKPADVVEWLGAVQAQEYEPAKWGLGLRMAEAVEADIERAFVAFSRSRNSGSSAKCLRRRARIFFLFAA